MSQVVIDSFVRMLIQKVKYDINEFTDGNGVFCNFSSTYLYTKGAEINHYIDVMDGIVGGLNKKFPRHEFFWINNVSENIHDFRIHIASEGKIVAFKKE